MEIVVACFFFQPCWSMVKGELLEAVAAFHEMVRPQEAHIFDHSAKKEGAVNRLISSVEHI